MFRIEEGVKVARRKKGRKRPAQGEAQAAQCWSLGGQPGTWRMHAPTLSLNQLQVDMCGRPYSAVPSASLRILDPNNHAAAPDIEKMPALFTRTWRGRPSDSQASPNFLTDARLDTSSSMT